MARVFGYGGSGWVDPVGRLQQITEQYQFNPGRAAGGSGRTGLLSGDARGWSDMLNEQQEVAALSGLGKALQGEGTYSLDQLLLPTQTADYKEDVQPSMTPPPPMAGYSPRGHGGIQAPMVGLASAGNPLPGTEEHVERARKAYRGY